MSWSWHLTALFTRSLLIRNDAATASGDWEVGQAIPGLVDLENEYGVSFGTIRAAQQVLVEERLLSS
jgi:DNA-binding GntR family transcriptional regulator